MGKLIAVKRVYLEGEWLEHDNPSHTPFIGRELSFDDLEQMVGQLFILTKYTQSRKWLKVCRVHKIVEDNSYEGFHRRLVYTDGKGTKSCGLVNEYWFTLDPPKGEKAYELKRVPYVPALDIPF